MQDVGLRDRVARIALAWLVALATGAVASAAHAQSDDALPTRVGRVANVQGTLRHSPGDAGGEWAVVGLNYPVAQGDNLWTDRSGRAEVDYGAGQFRLAGDTNVHVSRLDERQLALFVASGGVIVRVRYLQPDDSVRIDTASTQIALNRPGLYRIDVDREPPQTTLIVREGEADVATASGEARVLPGQIAEVSGTHDVIARIREGGSIDGFDSWSAERDRVYESPRASAYVSKEMVGQYDLDRYGQWQTYPEYGAVWFPTVDPEWAPYRFGYWTWLPAFGYTWVDNAPWGYAPFHYGRWTYIGGRWGWCPGDFVARPVWAPALVAWYGGGGLLATSNGVPAFAWVPLGWGEPFIPSWRCGSRCYARYNRPYAVNVAGHADGGLTRHANWSAPGGVTAVPAATLTTGRPVAIDRVPVATDRRVAPPLTTTPPAVRPAPVRPGAVRAGNDAPPPPATLGPRPMPSASLDTPRMTPTLPAAPRSPVVAVPPAGTIQQRQPLAATVRPVPVPPPAPAPAPIPAPPPSMPLPRMPVAPVPGTSPAPPAAVVPMPRAAPAPPPAAALPHPAAPRPPATSN